jgi:hypothetical protein
MTILLLSKVATWQRGKRRRKRRKRCPWRLDTSKAGSKQPKVLQVLKKKKKNITDDDILSFEQKKDLSELISKLDGPKLEKVIQIIHEGVPEIRDVSHSESEPYSLTCF